MSELNGFWFPVSDFSSQIQVLSYLAPCLFLCFFPIPQRLPDPGEDCGRQCQSLHRDCRFQVRCSVFLNCPLRRCLRWQPSFYGGENRTGGRGAPPSCDSGECLGQLCSALWWRKILLFLMSAGRRKQMSHSLTEHVLIDHSFTRFALCKESRRKQVKPALGSDPAPLLPLCHLWLCSGQSLTRLSESTRRHLCSAC